MTNVSVTDADPPIRELLRHWGKEAEQLSMQQQFQVTQKGLDDYVTSVDRELDRQLSAAFATLFPQDGIITEENSRSRRVFHQGYRHLWLIDPVDGTESFIEGKPDYSLMVGLLTAYQPMAGWIYVPAQDRMYFGGPEWGLFQTRGNYAPEPLPVREPLPPSVGYCPVMIGARDQMNFGRAIATLIPEIQFHSLGSFGLKVIEVICGRVGLYVYLNRRVKLWDTTGPLALAQAAGLVCCDLTGEPIRFQPDVIHAETLSHQQTIVIGWPSYIEALRPRIRQAFNDWSPAGIYRG